jgi:hypothetical protein
MTALRVLTIAAVVAVAAPAPAAAGVQDQLAQRHAEAHAFFDVRPSQGGTLRHATPALRAYVARLGPGAIADIDPRTRTPRWLGSRSGFLTAPARGAPRTIALRWLRGHLDVIGLRAADLRTLRLSREYRSIDGVTHLTWQQTVNGIPAFDNAIRVHVTRDGRLISVQGSPRAGLPGRVRSTTPRLDAVAALSAAARHVPTGGPSLVPRALESSGPRRLTLFAGGHRAQLILFDTARRTHLAWRMRLKATSTGVYDLIVDASTGRLLRRSNDVKWANGLAWDNYPAAPKGGEPRPRDFSRWLTATDRLEGNAAHVYADFDATDMAEPVEEIPPGDDGNWNYPASTFPSPTGFCPKAGCFWNHLVNGSWIPGIQQTATQVFFFVNTFADHLAAAPIGFTEAAGNFQARNAGSEGKPGDALQAEPLDSAALVAGRPVPVINSDNANMDTPPDGQQPRMQMYLFEPVQAAPLLDYPFSDVSGGDDASVVYHEYTHGLSNRLVTDPDGAGALDSEQAGAMGEAWSDFYAFDFLMKQGLVEDTDAPGEIKVGEFVDSGGSLVRSEPIDCRPGDPITACPRKRVPSGVTGKGGYTYAHFAKIAGGAEVHADGEIWAQTLMDLRRRLVAELGAAEGATHIEALVTRGMDLSPVEPSFLNMRDAILQADAVLGYGDAKAIWEVFAARGMGEDAKAADGKDIAPRAGFIVPVGLPDRPAKAKAPAAVADRLAPALAAQARQLRGGRVLLTGTASDAGGLKKVTVTGRTRRLAVSKNRFRVVLRTRARKLTVRAQDAAGNVRKRTIKVRRLR